MACIQGTAPASLKEVPSAIPSAVLALPGSEAQQAVAEQVIFCGAPNL